AGELGHISINFEGPECRCGSRGCLEAYCASHAIIRRAKKLMGNELTPAFEAILDNGTENLTIKKIFSAERKGDAVARQVLDETARYLGIGLAGIVNLLNPDTVVIGGGIIEGGGGLLEAVTAEIKERAFDSAVENLRVVKAALGNDAGFIGAGLLGEEKH
ncbi:MAG: ROK family protein, partial [candidate division Zixibacteria bacterium]|nr:ROK family protein [candidate division Zixibacteria bacterium]